MLAVGALGVAPLAVGGTAYGDTGPVPEEWGKPTVVFAQLQVVGREMGRLPGRLGNQHITEVDTIDEESVVGGSVLDWWCPAGAIAPYCASDETPCRLKAQHWIDFDYDNRDSLTENWSPRLRYVNMRIPIALEDASGAVVDRGMVSIHAKAGGALSSLWFEGDYQDVLTRQGARVTGGHFMGKPWLAMSSVEVVNDEMWLLRYYDPA
jgi:hypothetical protein